MPSPAERQRNNVRMGLFVSISILLAMGVLVTLTDAIDRFRTRTDQHTVRFSVQSGVGNLRPGSQVRVGGMSLGQVTNLTPQFSEDDGGFRFIDVQFDLDRQVKLRDDAVIMVSSPLIGTESWLDIPHVGEGQLVNGVLRGVERVGMLTSLLGHESAAHAQRLIEHSTSFAEFLASVRSEYDSTVLPTLENVRETSDDVRQVVQLMRQDHFPQWAEMIESILRQGSDSAVRLDNLLADSHAVVTENRGDLRSTIENVRGASEHWQEAANRINTETIDRVHALLDSGQRGLDEAEQALQTLRADYDGWAETLTQAMGRANLASQQLHLTMTEVRRSPWKVLYRPSEKELEHELLYEATRSFAVAAADLQAASASMQRVLDAHAETLDEDDVLLQRVRDNLLQPLERYELAQQQLLDVLFADQQQQ